MTPGDDDITSIFLLVVFFGCAQSTSVPNTQFSIDYLQYRLLFSLLCCSDVPRKKTISNKFRQLDLTDFMFQRHTKSLFSSCKSFQLFYLRINHYFLRFFLSTLEEWITKNDTEKNVRLKDSKIMMMLKLWNLALIHASSVYFYEQTHKNQIHWRFFQSFYVIFEEKTLEIANFFVAFFFWWSLFVSDTIDTNTLWTSTSEKYFYERMRCATWFGVKLAPISLWVIWVMLFCAKKTYIWHSLNSIRGNFGSGSCWFCKINCGLNMHNARYLLTWMIFFSYQLNAILIEKYKMTHRLKWK